MVVELLPDYDEKKTAKNVADYFQGKGKFKRYSYPRLVETEQVLGMVHSVTGDVTGVHGSGGNHTEDALIAKAHCRQALKCVTRAIDSCDYVQQVILRERYVNGQKRATVMALAGIGGNDQYQEADQAARNRFAAALDKLSVASGVSDLIPTLQA